MVAVAAAVAVATWVGEAVSTAVEAAVSTEAAQPFTAAASGVVDPYSTVARLEARRCSTAAAFATAASRSGTTAFIGISSLGRLTTPTTTITRITTLTAAAPWYGRI